jgi:hypothetical protein
MTMSGILPGSDISIIDQIANAAASFHPAVDAADNDGPYAPPCLEIGGVRVYAYVRDGILVVSLDYDAADIGDGRPGAARGHLRVASAPGPFAAYGAEDCVPTVIKAGEGPPPVWTALPEGADLPAWVYSE